MSSLRIEGGHRLSGRLSVEGNKNSALPLMAACMLTDQECVLTNVPDIRDVGVLSADGGVGGDYRRRRCIDAAGEMRSGNGRSAGCDAGWKAPRFGSTARAAARAPAARRGWRNPEDFPRAA